MAESDDTETTNVTENTVEVAITLSEDPERTVVIPIETTNQGGATAADYSGVPPSITFNAGDTVQTFTFTAEDDAEDDDGESVLLSFGTMPDVGVSAGSPNEATVSITDDDVPAVTVQFRQGTYAVTESDETGTPNVTENAVEVTVTLSADPERTVVIPIETTNQGGATVADYSGVPQSITFNAGDTAQTFTFTAEADAEDDDGETVLLGFGTMPDAGVSEGTPAQATVTITDDDDPTVTVMFGAPSYAVAEGGMLTTVALSADPERTVVIPVETTNQGGATTADYTGVPGSVTFNNGDTSKTFTFSADDDAEDDDGESVRLSFGTMPDALVSAGSPGETTVTITDDDDPTVTVMFGAPSYAVAEGGMLTVTVALSADPERTVVIPIVTTNQGGATTADYTGVPGTVTFNSGEDSKTFTFSADDDAEDDDGESVLLRFSTTLPPGVTAGTPDQATVSITDDDVPQVTVQFGQGAYTVAESDHTETANVTENAIEVTVTLSADPERTVVIPIETTDQGGATAADYSGVPQSITFNAGDTAQTFTFTAEDDADDDDGESVLLGFGTMPDAGVSEGSPDEATVNIRQFDTEFTLDCNTAVWCADVTFSDHSALDWGLPRLQLWGLPGGPPSSLSDSSFTFRGREYRVRRMELNAGTYPTLPNPWSSEWENDAEFSIFIHTGFYGPPPRALPGLGAAYRRSTNPFQGRRFYRLRIRMDRCGLPGDLQRLDHHDGDQDRHRGGTSCRSAVESRSSVDADAR